MHTSKTPGRCSLDYENLRQRENQKIILRGIVHSHQRPKFGWSF
jgi:hypothetical protein